MEILSSIHKRLRKLRENRPNKDENQQVRWAEKMGLKKSILSRIETGERHGNFDELEAIVNSGLLNDNEIFYLVTGRQIDVGNIHLNENLEKLKIENESLKKELEQCRENNNILTKLLGEKNRHFKSKNGTGSTGNLSHRSD